MAVQEIPTPDTISVAMLHHLRQRDPLARILDVRTGREFESAHIPNSYNVPLNTLVEHIDEFVSIDHPIVLVCQSGGRAGQAHKRLAAAGKTTLHVLDGGVSAWIASNGDLAQGHNQRWALDRQVRLMAGSVAIGSILASKVVPGAKWMAAARRGGPCIYGGDKHLPGFAVRGQATLQPHDTLRRGRRTGGASPSLIAPCSSRPSRFGFCADLGCARS